MKIRLLLLIFFNGLFVYIFAQDQEKITPSQFGYTGIIYTPTAYLPKWKTIDAGFTHFNKETSFTYLGGIEAERAFITNLVFLPRVELTVKLTRPYSVVRPDYQPGSGRQRNWGIGDRSYSLRVQVLEEKDNQPSLVLGIQDPFANLAFFHTNYLVASKKIPINEISILTNIGYGISLEDTNGDYLQGLFGGVQVSWKGTIANIEYDTKTLNMGLGYQLKERLFFNMALINVKYFSGNISYRFGLK